MKKIVNKMENSELLAHFLISRDNLISIRRALVGMPRDDSLNNLFEIEEKNYNELLTEIYRRMQYARNKR